MTRFTLVLLPGLDGTGDLFEPFVAALGATVKPLVIRYPEDVPQDYQVLEAHVRQQLPAHEPFVLLGESFSGPIAIAIAAAPPANLAATVLCCTFASCPRPALARLRGLLPLTTPRLAPLWAASALLMGRHATPKLRAALGATLARLAPSVFRARLLAVLDVDVRPQLAAVPGPVLYMQALQDQVVPAQAAASVLQANPRVQVARLGGPHFLLQARPAQAAAEVLAFLSALTKTWHPPANRPVT